jgi:hypothetical protein
MNIQVHHVIVHNPEQVREIIAEACTIADGSEVAAESWVAVFEQACTLLGARFSLAMNPEPVPFSLGALGPTNHRKR